MSSSTQRTLGIGAKTFTYRYLVSDFLGEIGYPSGRKFASCPNGDNQVAWLSAVKSMTDCQNGIAPAGASEAYASGIQYTPHRAMSQVTLGNTRVENSMFNDRLQLSRTRLGTSANTGVCGTGGDEWCVDIAYGSSAARNIGNLSEQTMFAKKPDGNFLSIKTAYQYDGVNCLATSLGYA